MSLFLPCLHLRRRLATATVTPPTPMVRIQGGFKLFKPITPGLRHKKSPVRDHLHPGRPVRFLTLAKRKTGGRNNTGRITTRHRGGGHKRRIRIIDWLRADAGKQRVVRLEYDPGRSAHIALLKHTGTRTLSYIVAPDGLKPGDEVESFAELAGTRALDRMAPEKRKQHVADKEEGVADDAIAGYTRQLPLNVGNCLPLSHIPPGTLLHCIGLQPRRPPALARSAGTSAQLLAKTPTHAQLKLGSGEVRLVNLNAIATIGRVSNPEHHNRKYGKAGVRRWLGWRPTVRGVAMNKVDHPMGGGRGKSKSNKHPRSPWGKLSKGGRTRKKGANPLVIKERPRR